MLRNRVNLSKQSLDRISRCLAVKGTTLGSRDGKPIPSLDPTEAQILGEFKDLT